MADVRPFEHDLATLLEPIEGDNPAGVSLRRDRVYDQIREARRAEDPRLSQGIWKTDVKQSDWSAVERMCLEALSRKTKDLRIAAWLTEAWIHLYGATGGVQGVRLMERLCEQFWESIHPTIDGDDFDARLAPVAWLNEAAAHSLKSLPLTRPETKEPQIYTWLDWESATHRERHGGGGGRSTATDVVTTDKITTCVLLTSATFYADLSRELGELWNSIVDFSHLLDELVGRSLASLWRFKEMLKSIRDFVARALDQKSEGDSGSAAEVEASEDIEATDRPASFGVRRGPIRSRAEAYQRLEEAAEYLLRTEPHSPTPHLVKRAVSWGGMTFTELIRELVMQESDLRAIYALLGIPPK